MDKYELLKKIEMPDEAVAVIRDIDLRLERDPGSAAALDGIRARFFAGENVRPEIAELAKKLGVHEYELSLAFFASCSGEAERRMKAQGHPEKVFTDSMRDLMIWAKFSRKSYGVWGIREFDWLARTLRAELWRLGRLQFERYEFDYDDFSFGGLTVKRGDIVLNTHIPADGPFPKEARLDSYLRAYDWFGIDTYICDSYLLYPPQVGYLDPDCNVVSFFREWHIIRSGAAGSFHNLRYLYGDMEKYDISALPRDTAMRRSILKMADELGDIGWGVGVLFCDGEKIY
ncbi:MAG: DUF5596 domain-containing protein [Clostridia bacterium]|nr:DUF5596 domain-containing protein [Clostridia bacterium]